VSTFVIVNGSHHPALRHSRLRQIVTVWPLAHCCCQTDSLCGRTISHVGSATGRAIRNRGEAPPLATMRRCSRKHTPTDQIKPSSSDPGTRLKSSAPQRFLQVTKALAPPSRMPRHRTRAE
jgi:hypothetical protein